MDHVKFETATLRYLVKCESMVKLGMHTVVKMCDIVYFEKKINIKKNTYT